MIRRAKLGDIPDLVMLNSIVHNVHVELFPEVFKIGDDNLVANFFASLLRSEDCTIFISREAGISVGYIMIRKQIKPGSSLKKETRCAYIDQVSVHPDYRRKGIFASLLESAEKEAASWGMKRLELDVWSENSSAVEAYERSGFRTYNQKMFVSIED